MGPLLESDKRFFMNSYVVSSAADKIKKKKKIRKKVKLLKVMAHINADVF